MDAPHYEDLPNAQSDLTYVQTPGADPARIAAMMSKIFDAALLNPPYYKHAVAGGMKILANMAEMDIPIQHIALVTSRRFVAQSRLEPPHREIVS